MVSPLITEQQEHVCVNDKGNSEHALLENIDNNITTCYLCKLLGKKWKFVRQSCIKCHYGFHISCFFLFHNDDMLRKHNKDLYKS